MRLAYVPAHVRKWPGCMAREYRGSRVCTSRQCLARVQSNCQCSMWCQLNQCGYSVLWRDILATNNEAGFALGSATNESDSKVVLIIRIANRNLSACGEVRVHNQTAWESAILENDRVPFAQGNAQAKIFLAPLSKLIVLRRHLSWDSV